MVCFLWPEAWDGQAGNFELRLWRVYGFAGLSIYLYR